MTRCPYTHCGYPKGYCAGLCMHRAVINTETMTKPVVAIKGKVEELPVQFAEPEPKTKETPMRDAFAALVKWWKSNHGMRQAFRQAVRAYKTRHIPDPFKEQA